MSERQKRQRHGGNRGIVQELQVLQTSRALCGHDITPTSGNHGVLPVDWREHLPSPESYYRGRVVALGDPNARGWALGRCPFHDDPKQSLAVDLWDAPDYWACFSCCALGDMVDFHQRLTGKELELAVLDLLRIRV